MNAKRCLLLLSSVMLLMLVAVSNVACGGDDDEGEGGGKEEQIQVKPGDLLYVWRVSEVKTSESGAYQTWEDYDKNWAVSQYGGSPQLMNFVEAGKVHGYLHGEMTTAPYTLNGNLITIKSANESTMEVLSLDKKSLECKVNIPGSKIRYMRFVREYTPTSTGGSTEYLCRQWRLTEVPAEYKSFADECYYEFRKKDNNWRTIVLVRNALPNTNKYAQYGGQYVALEGVMRFDVTSFVPFSCDISEPNVTLGVRKLYDSGYSKYCHIFLTEHFLRGDLGTAVPAVKTITYTDLNK